VSPKNKIKTLAYVADGKNDKSGKAKSRAIVVLLRGDHQLNEAKFAAARGGGEVRPMQEEEIQQLFSSPAGFLGPIGVAWARERNDQDLPLLLVDTALEGRKNLIAGANREDYHLKNVSPGVDFEPTAYMDLRSVTGGDACPKCGCALTIDHAVEVGHIFKLGYKYTESMGARVLDQNGREVMPIMGCYGIGIERILTAAVEQSHDEQGFWLPPQIAPFAVVVTPTNASDERLLNIAQDVTRQLEAAGFDVLLDDRDERPGVKFKDADLVGMPFRVTVGKKVTEGMLEVVDRSTRETNDVTIAAIGAYFEALPLAR
jgi:prolyl-tRNA synthetase